MAMHHNVFGVHVVILDLNTLYTAMNVTNNATPIVKQRWVYSILKELHYQ